MSKSKLEEEFTAAYKAAIERLKAKDAEARKAVQELEDICEETGIPYQASVSPLSQIYQPSSFKDMWGKTRQETVKKATWDKKSTYDVDIFEAVTGDYPGEYDGWQHSAVCY